MSALLAGELVKMRTTRGPLLLLAALLALTALGVVSAVGADLLDPTRRAAQLAQTASFGLVFGTLLGILLVTTEFRHGTITPTLLVEPRRERLVVAKLAVGTLGSLLYGLLAGAVLLAIALPWLGARGDALAVDAELGGALLRLTVAFALAGALGVGIGFAVRSQVGAIVTTLAWFLVGESLLPLLALLVDRDEGAARVNRYLPGTAFEALVAGGGGDLMSPWPALLLVLGYVAALAAIGLLVTLKRDAV